MQNSKMMWNSPFDGTTASGNDIQTFILLDFCINPSHEVTLAETYTREGFMQKPQMVWNLPHFIYGV